MSENAQHLFVFAFVPQTCMGTNFNFQLIYSYISPCTHQHTARRLDLAGQQHQMRKFRTGRVHAECSRKLPSELWGLNCGRRSGACHLHTYKSTHSITVRAHSHTPPTARAAHHLPRRGLPLEAAVRALGAELSPSILLSCLYADNHT
jgi:hypothetical protein